MEEAATGNSGCSWSERARQATGNGATAAPRPQPPRAPPPGLLSLGAALRAGRGVTSGQVGARKKVPGYLSFEPRLSGSCSLSALFSSSYKEVDKGYGSSGVTRWIDMMEFRTPDFPCPSLTDYALLHEREEQLCNFECGSHDIRRAELKDGMIKKARYGSNRTRACLLSLFGLPPESCNLLWKAVLAQTPSCLYSDSEKTQGDQIITQVLMLCKVFLKPR
ncbi:uncharacterized protein [Physeter macrocephalus]|uniref:Uncharacterized protein n=1 Tax=Physeter macrocephalus TaxID=9755 RepID=A0A9W2WNT4_PHYMC|nr:uncharacterized protein LOC129392110 [Physeter catodon]